MMVLVMVVGLETVVRDGAEVDDGGRMMMDAVEKSKICSTHIVDRASRAHVRSEGRCGKSEGGKRRFI